MEHTSKREISQKKFKDISLGVSAYGAISAWFILFIMKSTVGVEEASLLAIDGTMVLILGLIIYKTKSKVTVGILISFLLLGIGVSVAQMLEVGSINIAGLIIKAIIIYYLFTLFEHINNINTKQFNTSIKLTF